MRLSRRYLRKWEAAMRKYTGDNLRQVLDDLNAQGTRIGDGYVEQQAILFAAQTTDPVPPANPQAWLFVKDDGNGAVKFFALNQTRTATATQELASFDEFAHYIIPTDQDTAATAGRVCGIQGGMGNTTGAGGQCDLIGGPGGDDGNGGNAGVTGGRAGGGDRNGGSAILRAGTQTGAGTPGQATMRDSTGNDIVTVGPTASTLAFYGGSATTQPTITGSRGGNAALASLLTALAAFGLIVDSTTA